MFKFASLLSNFLIQSPFRHLCKVLLDTKILFVSPQYHDLIFILGSSKQFKIKKLLNVNDTSASLLLRVGNWDRFRNYYSQITDLPKFWFSIRIAVASV